MKKFKFGVEVFWDMIRDEEIMSAIGLALVACCFLIVVVLNSVVMVIAGFLGAICIISGNILFSLYCVVIFLLLRFLNKKIGNLFEDINNRVYALFEEIDNRVLVMTIE